MKNFTEKLFTFYHFSAVPDDIDSLMSSDLGHAPSHPLAPPTKRGLVFSERSVEVYQPPLLPSSTPHTLSHHFLTYNVVGVVRSHTDDSAAMIEVMNLIK